MQIFRAEFTAMACRNEVVVAAENEAQAQPAMNAAAQEVLRIEAKYSRYRPESVVSQLNAAAGNAPLACDEETGWLLDFAAALYNESDGLFDITAGLLRRAWDFSKAILPDQAQLDALLPLVGFPKLERDGLQVRLPQTGMEIDFGGFGKEYAADRAAMQLQQHGMAHGYVNLGGDLRALGPQPDGTPWQVGIVDPRAPGNLIAQVPVSQGGLATSGDYEKFFDLDGRRYCHLLNPQTGWPVAYWRSVSVLAPNCLAAGAYATATMLKESTGLDLLRAAKLRWLAIGPDGEILRDEPETSTQSRDLHP